MPELLLLLKYDVVYFDDWLRVVSVEEDEVVASSQQMLA